MPGGSYFRQLGSLLLYFGLRISSAKLTPLCVDFTSLHLNTKVISRGCSFQNYAHLRIPKMRVKTDCIGGGHIYVVSGACCCEVVHVLSVLLRVLWNS